MKYWNGRLGLHFRIRTLGWGTQSGQLSWYYEGEIGLPCVSLRTRVISHVVFEFNIRCLLVLLGYLSLVSAFGMESR